MYDIDCSIVLGFQVFFVWCNYTHCLLSLLFWIKRIENLLPVFNYQRGKIWQLGLVTIIIIHVELGVHLTHYTRGLSFRGLSFRGSEFSRSEFSRTRNFRPLQKSDELRSNKHSGSCFSQQKTIIIIHVELGFKISIIFQGVWVFENSKLQTPLKMIRLLDELR